MRHKSFLLFLAILGLGCKSNSTSPNDAPTISGNIVFEQAISNVATINIGSGESQGRFDGTDPSWTPDGRILYTLDYTLSNDGHEYVNIANPDGTGATHVINMVMAIAGYAVRPHMSKDGKYISINYNDDLNSTLGTTYGTLLYTSSGQSIGSISDAYDASWTPDGGLVLSGSMLYLDGYTRGQYPGLYKVDNTFTKATPIGSGLTTPMWPAVSPDGQRVAFVQGHHVWLINIDGTGLKQLTAGPNNESYPCWSPDGKTIAAQSYGDFAPTYGNEVCVVSADATSPVTVSPTTSNYIQDKSDRANGLLNPVGSMDWKN